MIDNKRLYELTDLDCNSFRVLWYLSYGYDWALSIGNEYYEASYSQIRQYTGIRTDDTVIRCIRLLVKKGLITQNTDWVAGNQKTKSKFTSSVVLQKMEYSTPKNGAPVLQKMEHQYSKKKSKSTPKNGELSKENKSKEISKEKTNTGEYNSRSCFTLEDAGLIID